MNTAESSRSYWDDVRPLGEVCELVKGKKPKNTGIASTERTIPYINIEAFESGQPSEYAEPGDYPACHQGEVLIVWDGARSGLVGRAIQGYMGSTLARVQSNVASNDYLFYFLKSQYPHINSRTKGVGIPHVDPQVFNRIAFPIASPNEQKRIVAEIEKQFSRLDEADSNLRRLKANISRYKAAVLAAAISGRLVETEAEIASREGRMYESGAQLLERILLERQIQRGGRGKFKEPVAANAGGLPTLAEGWAWATVEQVATVATGATPLRSDQKYYKNGAIPWITSGALNSEFVSAANEFITSLALERTNAKLFPRHTLLIAMYGEGKTRGKISELLIDAATNQACAAIIMNGLAVAVRPFTKLFFIKNYSDMRKLSSGGVQPNLSLGVIKRTCIPVPPLAEQERIVSEVDRRFSLIRQIEEQISASAKRLQQLRQAILQQAFTISAAI